MDSTKGRDPMEDVAVLRQKVRDADAALRQLEEIPQRRAAARALKLDAHKRHAQDEPPARRAQEQAAAAARDAQAVAAERNAAAQRSYFALQGVNGVRDRAVASADFELRETAPSCLHHFLDELETLFSKARHSHQRNGPALVKAIQAARQRTEEAMLDPTRDDEADELVRKLRASIPALEGR